MNITKTLYLALLLVFAGCWGLERNGGAFERIAPGNWRGVFSFEEDGDKVPITFEVKNTDKKGNPTEITFKNGDFSFQPDSLLFWGDTLFCHFNEPQRYLKMTYETGLMEGYLFDKNKQDYPIKFLAQNGAYQRYPDLHETDPIAAQASGDWKLQFSLPQDSSQKVNASLVLQQKAGHSIYGKLITTDSVFKLNIDLEGLIQKNRIYMSGFDGGKVVSITATFMDTDYLENGALRINQWTYYCNALKSH